MQDSRFPHILWSLHPWDHTLWGIRHDLHPIHWHDLAPQIRAAQTDRGVWVVLHCDHTPLPPWDPMLHLFPSLREWVHPDLWALFLAQYEAADRHHPIPLWLP